MNARRRRIEARLRLTRLALGGLAARTLFAANELGVFEYLHRAGPSTGAEVATALGTHPDATTRLLGALVASGVLEHEGDRFANGVLGREFLVPDTPESMATWVRLIGTWDQRFDGLVESVRTGTPGQDPEDHLGMSPEYTRAFVLGMHDYAMGPGRELARHLDLSGRRRLLDVGGGPGTYSIILAEANPTLNCTVFDLPDIVGIAEEVIERHGLSDRVSTRAGDFHTDSFPVGNDAVLISNTLHQEDDEGCARILKAAYHSLEPGGICVIHAMALNEAQDGPPWPALHNVLMFLISRGGRAYTVGQYSEQLLAAGFEDPTPKEMSTFNAGSVIVASRP